MWKGEEKVNHDAIPRFVKIFASLSLDFEEQSDDRQKCPNKFSVSDLLLVFLRQSVRILRPWPMLIRETSPREEIKTENQTGNPPLTSRFAPTRFISHIMNHFFIQTFGYVIIIC